MDIYIYCKLRKEGLDIGAARRPQVQMLYWTRRVVEEFWAQGDEELRLDIEVRCPAEQEGHSPLNLYQFMIRLSVIELSVMKLCFIWSI